MLHNLKLNRILFVILGVLSLLVSVTGVLYPTMYAPLISASIMPGAFTQDVLVVVSSLLLIGLALKLKADGYRQLIVIIGLLGFLFYAYGIYSIEQVYTLFYPLYLAILSLSFYALAFSLSSINNAAVEALHQPTSVRYVSAGYGVFIAIMFNFIWISQLLPLIETSNRIEYTFSVYIIDLVFIMPGFVIAAILAVKNRAVGIVALPGLFIVGVGILSPLALAELLKPYRYGMVVNPSEFWLYGTLTVLFVVFALVYLFTLRAENSTSA